MMKIDKKKLSEWKHLTMAAVDDALYSIDKVSDKDVSEILDFTKSEIKTMVKNFNIKENELLINPLCTIEEYSTTKLSEKEEKVFNLIKQGLNINEITENLLISTSEVKSTAKSIIARILIGLYDYYAPNRNVLSKYRNPALMGIVRYGFYFGKAVGKIGEFCYEFDTKGKVHLKFKCDSLERLSKNYSIVEIENKYGLIDNYGNFLIKPEYEALELSSCRIQPSYRMSYRYFKVMLNGKWGIIDIKKGVKIDFKYDYIDFWGDYKHLFVILNGKLGMIDINENVIIPFLYEGLFSPWLLFIGRNEFVVKKDGKSGVLNFQNEVVIPFEYDRIEDIRTYQHYFVKDVVIAVKEGRVGVINRNNETVIPFKYNNVIILSNETVAVQDYPRGGYYIVNYSTKRICDINFQDIRFLGRKNYFCAKVNNKYGLIDEYGKVIIDFKYDDWLISLNEDLFIAEKNLKQGIIDINENIIVAFEYHFVCYYLPNTINTICAGKIIDGERKFGLINLKNEVILDFKYDKLCYREKGLLFATIGPRWMYINKKGEPLKIDFDSCQ